MFCDLPSSKVILVLFTRVANATFCILIYVGTRHRQAPELSVNERQFGSMSNFTFSVEMQNSPLYMFTSVIVSVYCAMSF